MLSSSRHKHERYSAMTENTYRGRPTDTTYKSATEVPSCFWCRWRSPSTGDYDNKQLYACLNPVHNPTHRTPSVKNFNEEGECQQYEPSGFTKLVRLVGLRKPVRT